MDVGCERKLAALFLADETRGSGAKLKVCGTVLGGGTSALFSDQYGRAAGATTSDFLFPSVFCPPSSVFATLWQTITFGSKTHLPALSLSMGPSTPYTQKGGTSGGNCELFYNSISFSNTYPELAEGVEPAEPACASAKLGDLSCSPSIFGQLLCWHKIKPARDGQAYT
jgi:hypothetical protein